MAFNPAEASAAIEAGRLPETVRTFILEDGTIGNTHFVAIPFNAAHKEGAMVVADFLLSPEAQAQEAGSDRLGRLHRARRRSAGAGRPRALRSPAARHRDPAARGADAGPARAASVLDDRDRGGVAAPLQQLDGLAAHPAGLDHRALPGAGRGRAARHAPARVRLSAGARRRAALARALAPAFAMRRASPQHCACPWSAASSATALALALTILVFAAGHGTRTLTRAKQRMTPLLAVPHLAMAIGLAFLIAPSGWLVRLVSPWLTGWDRPPDLALVQDPHGLALTLGLVLKETPFLILMTFAALGQVRADDQLRMARTLGYGPVSAWLKVVLPQVYPQIRLPVYAVLAYSLSVVDMAIVLGPDHAADARGAGAALVQRSRPRDALSGRRGRLPAARWSCCGDRPLARPRDRCSHGLPGRGWSAAGAAAAAGRATVAAWSGTLLLIGLALGSLLSLAVWSVAGSWRFPDAWPAALSLDGWTQRLHARGAARLDDARGRARDHAARAAPGRGLPREREPAAPSAGPRRADPDLPAAAGAADRLPVRRPGAAGPARARRHARRGGLGASAVRAALRLPDARRPVPQPRSALRPQRALARQAALGGLAAGEAGDAAAPAADRRRRRLRGQRRAVPADAVRRRRPDRDPDHRGAEPRRRRQPAHGRRDRRSRSRRCRCSASRSRSACRPGAFATAARCERWRGKRPHERGRPAARGARSVGRRPRAVRRLLAAGRARRGGHRDGAERLRQVEPA